MSKRIKFSPNFVRLFFFLYVLYNSSESRAQLYAELYRGKTKFQAKLAEVRL